MFLVLVETHCSVYMGAHHGDEDTCWVAVELAWNYCRDVMSYQHNELAAALNRANLVDNWEDIE
jgi:hypothetical protein